MSTPPPPSFRDPQRPLRDRVDDLLDQLTGAEKLALLHQHQAPVPRLGIQPFRTGTEVLHGVAWLGHATVFPQAIGLATTWNPDLVRAVGSAVGDEVRAFHHKDPAGAGLNVWAPVVNPLRDPRWGRNEEGYSEDPWLTGRLATAYGQGLIGDDPRHLRTVPTLKHFLAYNNETDRCETSSTLPPRVLHEYELPAFRTPLREGAAFAMMPSYNLVNGRPAHLSPLINEVVRPWLDDELLVVSDAGAPANLVEPQRCHADHAAAYAAAVRAGVDSFTQDGADPQPTIRALEEALERGLLTREEVDRAARRALTIRFRLGEFDPPALSAYEETAADVVNSPEHQRLAREAARQSIVLLKRECQLLPLAADRIGRMLVVGPLADTLYEDWYSGTMPYQVTALDGISERLPEGAVEYFEGVDRIALRQAGTDRFLVADSVGRPLRVAAREVIEHGWFDLFDWGGGAVALRSVRNQRHLSVNDSGELVDDQPGPNGWEVKQTFQLVETAEGTVLLRHLHSGRFVSVDATGAAGLHADEPPTAFVLETVVDAAARAAELAGSVDVAVVVLGNHPLVNGRETEDRADLDLPAAQDRLLRAVHAANPRTVLVISSSYPFAIDWAQRHLPAVLWSSHGGQEYGHALADVLFGDVDPGGRLPQTWYRSACDLPELLDYDIIATDATYLYYRGNPLYPFGHGLSYTTFAYSDLRLSSASISAEGECEVTLTVTNTGPRDGVEVVQLYTHQQRSRTKQPLRQLRGFERLELPAGASREVRFVLRGAELGHWDVTRGRWCVETARHSILVGRSATDTTLTATVDVHGERIPPRAVLSAPLEAVGFDQYSGITITDAAPERGDAVRSLEPGSWVAFDDVDLGAGAGTCTARVANTGHEPATISLRLDDPLHGPLIGSLTVQPTADRYTRTVASSNLSPDASGLHTLYLTFSHPDVVLERLTFH